MSVRTSKSILIAVLLWIVILSGIAAALRYFVLPELREKKMARLAGQTGSEGRYKSTVRIALDGFSGYCVLRSTEFSDRLARAGIRVDVQDDGADYTARMKALRDGDVQMAVFPVNSFIQSGVELGEFPASIVYLIDETVGADAMVAFKSAVPTIQALNRDDARIVLTSGSPSELLARVMIASFNLPDLPDKKWLVSANGAEDVFNRFRGDTSGKPVAYALWEPYVSKAMKLPDAIVLLDSSKMKGFIVDVLVAERQFLIDHYDIAKEVVENYARAAYGVQGTMPELILADAKQNGEKISLEEARQMAKGIRWKSTLENYAAFGSSGAGQSGEGLEDMIFKITQVLEKTGALSKDGLSVSPNTLYFSRIVSEMKASSFHPGAELSVLTGVDLGFPGEVAPAVQELKPLTEAQWGSLLAVGELRVEPVAFGRGTSEINVQSQRQIQELAKTLMSWPQYYLTVTGRVRPGGDSVAALGLARERANATVQALISAGVPPVRIRSFAEVAPSNYVGAQSVSFEVGQLPY